MHTSMDEWLLVFYSFRNNSYNELLFSRYNSDSFDKTKIFYFLIKRNRKRVQILF